MQLQLAGLVKNSVVDGPGLRTVVFTQGCPHNCPGCHNPQTQSQKGGSWIDVAELAAEISSERGVRGVTFSGGEPFAQAGAMAELAVLLKKNNLNIIIYTGYLYEELAERAKWDPATAALLIAGDVLIDGLFMLAERDLSLLYRGSRNQRIIDLPATVKSGTVVLSPWHNRGQEQAYA